MKWKIPICTLGAILTPIVVAAVVSFNSQYFILDNPDFWYGYMGYVGTVALAGAALWQNESFRSENQRKEELSIRPYLFSSIEDENIELMDKEKIEYLNVKLYNESNISVLGLIRENPDDVKKYTKLRMQHDNFNYTVKSEAEKLKKMISLTEIVKAETTALSALNKKYMLISYNLENHGTGGAVKIQIMLNDNLIVPKFCLSHTEKKQLFFLMDCENLYNEQTAKFEIHISFYNIEDFGPYEQFEEISIQRTAEGFLNLIINEQSSSPRLVKE